MTRINSNFTVLKSGIDPAIRTLSSNRELGMSKDDAQKLQELVVQGRLKKIEVVDVEDNDFGPVPYKFEPEKKSEPEKKIEEKDCKDYVLRIARSRIDVIEGIRNELHSKQAVENELYTQDESSHDTKAVSSKDEEPLTQEEQKTKATLKYVSEILDRAFNRRTTLTSWVLYFTLCCFGFKQMDDFAPVAEALKDSDFIKTCTEYRRLAEYDQEKANKFLDTAFSEDKEDAGKRRKLVKTASFVIDNSNKLNLGFVKTFPKIFGIQNVIMPWLKAFLPNIKLFDFMVTINPWLCEVSENFGNYTEEIDEIQSRYHPDYKGEKTICEVNLTPLSFKEFSLQKIIKNVHDGFNRVLGKESTLSSVVANLLVKKFRGKDFKTYSNEFINDNDFVRELYKGLEESKGKSAWNVPNEKFKDNKDKLWISRFILGITSFAKSVTPEWVKESSNTFGAIFVPLNLAMPLIAKVFHKGISGTITHTLLKIFPLANELFFDHLGNFRKEILDVQNEIKKGGMEEMIPELKAESKFGLLTSAARNMWESIKGFAQGRFSGAGA